VSQTGGWYVELEELWIWKSVKEHMDITSGQGEAVVQFLSL